MLAGRRRACVIGLDGATFDVLDKWVASGDMPHLAGLMAQGSRSRLISTIPPVTGPAWTSMTTGVGTGAHGIFDFLKWTPGTGEARVVESGDVSVPRIWDVAGADGLSVGVLGVPVTFPAQPVNGFLVAGMLAPRSGEATAFPRSLYPELAGEGLDLVERALPPAVSAGCLRAITESHAQAGKAAAYLVRRFSPDFFMVVFREVDRAQHRFWSYCAQDADAVDAELRAGVRDFFRAVDAAIGLLTAHYGPDAAYFVVSDHGFGPAEGYCELNRFLADKGFLAFDPRRVRRRLLTGRAVGAAKRLISGAGLLGPAVRALAGLVGARRVARISRNVFGHWAGAVRWDRTLAFARSRSDYGIWVNLRGREPYGVVEPGEQYERVRSELIAALRSLRHPETGENLISSVWRREEIVRGPHVAEAPDVYFVLKGGAVGRDLSARGPLVQRFPPGWGTHRMEGVLVACGPGIRAGRQPDAQITDVAPTVLYAMGLPVPAHMEGEVVTRLFTDEFVARQPVERVEHAAPARSAEERRPVLSPEDAELVKARLRDLGYI